MQLPAAVWKCRARLHYRLKREDYSTNREALLARPVSTLFLRWSYLESCRYEFLSLMPRQFQPAALLERKDILSMNPLFRKAPLTWCIEIKSKLLTFYAQAVEKSHVFHSSHQLSVLSSKFRTYSAAINSVYKWLYLKRIWIGTLLKSILM